MEEKERKVEDKEEKVEEKKERGSKKENRVEEKKMDVCNFEKHMEVNKWKVEKKIIKMVEVGGKRFEEGDTQEKAEDEEGEEEEQMDNDMNKDMEGKGNFKNEEEEAGPKKVKPMRRKDYCENEEDEEAKRGWEILEREREEEEVVVVGRVKERMGALVWEYAEQEYAEQEYAEWEYEERENASEWEYAAKNIQRVLPSYTWYMNIGKEAISQRRRMSILREKHCMTNHEITRRREDECREVWRLDHEREDSCYSFSDNTCVVCTRVVFTGQCIFHK